jgi:hypothetical protein
MVPHEPPSSFPSLVLSWTKQITTVDTFQPPLFNSDRVKMKLYSFKNKNPKKTSMKSELRKIIIKTIFLRPLFHCCSMS